MKYFSYFIFFAFIIFLLLFLKNALEPAEEPILITGTDKCGECHVLKNNGDQLTPWRNSKHSNAYNTLLGLAATEYNKKNGLKSPELEEKCLKCHTTEFSLGNKGKDRSYNIKEGVGCESCHGAGSKYSPAEIMRSETDFLRAGGEKGDEATCLHCHSEKGNKDKVLKDNLCPFQLNDFDYKISI